MRPRNDGWRQVQELLPTGWSQKAHELRAFQRSSHLSKPDAVLRMLLFHAVSGTGLRLTTQALRMAGIAHVGPKSLWQRFRRAGPWLRWIATELCHSAWACPSLPPGRRLRIADATMLQRPGVQGSDFRLHYTLDLSSLTCDWFDLTDAHRGERLTRIPLREGDVLLLDRHYVSAHGLEYVRRRHGEVIARLRWRHLEMWDERGRSFRALSRARSLKVNETGEWKVSFKHSGHGKYFGRVVSHRLPLQKYLENKEKVKHRATRKGGSTLPETFAAARFVMLLTTVPEAALSGQEVLELYRFRWQVEIAFRLFKQLLRIGELPHKNHAVAESWLLAKLVIVLLIERLRRSLFLPADTGVLFDPEVEPNIWRWTALALKALEPVLCPPVSWEEFLQANEERMLALHEEGRQEQQLAKLGEILQRWFI